MNHIQVFQWTDLKVMAITVSVSNQTFLHSLLQFRFYSHLSGTDNTPIGSQDAELARSDGYGSSTTGATDSRTDGVTGAREHESPVAKMLHGNRGVGSNTLE